MADPDYSALDQLLHRLALNYRSIAEVSFDLDQAIVRRSPIDVASGRHVFVSGLARAGTTLLMRRFHGSGRYRSLTYRDMPFVLAPNLWARLSAVSPRIIERSERAHGDRLLVDADSPESLDEVFWRIFAGDEYIAADHLRPHDPDDELVKRYVAYVNAILFSGRPSVTRYLSKNNNNILRLTALRRGFPEALILVPFRDPIQHAMSLLDQHVRFSRMQAERPFSLNYMTWLGHHEFGLGHRPFRFARSRRSGRDPGSVEYWLELWCETYSWLTAGNDGSAVFVCYEDLCRREEVWQELARLADVPPQIDGAERFSLRERPAPEIRDAELSARAAQIHARLRERSGSLGGFQY